MPSPNRKSKTALVVVLFLILLVLHQDMWFWGDDSFVLGFMPVGLFYHALYSVCCAILGFLAIKLAWPVDEDEDSGTGSSTEGQH